jgi:hypothetical protein
MDSDRVVPHVRLDDVPETFAIELPQVIVHVGMWRTPCAHPAQYYVLCFFF